MKVHPLEFEKPIVELEKQLDELRKHSKLHSFDLEREVRAMEEKIEETKREIYDGLTAWQKVQIARHTARPFALDYLNSGFFGFLRTARRSAFWRRPGYALRVRHNWGLPLRRCRASKGSGYEGEYSTQFRERKP